MSPDQSVPADRWSIDVHLDAAAWGPALARDVEQGLRAHPKQLPPKWFYDDRGSELFDQITRLPEYYPTRAEREILRDRADEIAAVSQADTLVELGSGTSDKTELLLDALDRQGRLAAYLPFDVSEETLRTAAARVAGARPGVRVHAVVGDFDEHLDRIPSDGRRMVAFLGSTIGNLTPAERSKFLASLRASLRPGDELLVGTDLVKDPDRLVRAYDDAAGVTAEFNLNVLRVINRELGADFDLDGFDHRAVWDAEREWIEMHLVARRAQTVAVADLDLSVTLTAGEWIHTEISAKFRPEGVAGELEQAGFESLAFHTDRAGDFGLTLAAAVD